MHVFEWHGCMRMGGRWGKPDAAFLEVGAKTELTFLQTEATTAIPH